MYLGSPFSYLLLAFPVALLWLWWTGVRAKELAVGHAKKACRSNQVQFLDQTVSLKKMSLARSDTGSSCLRRVYDFEFTNEGAHRDRGEIELKGFKLIRVYFPYMHDAEGNRIYFQ